MAFVRMYAGFSEIWNGFSKNSFRFLQNDRKMGLQVFLASLFVLSWLPVVGDPLCAVAGWLRLPFWPCVAYMAVGKFARYVVMTGGLLWVFPQHWGIG